MAPPQPTATTRRRLLEIGQEEVYLHGFQAAPLGAILTRAGVTKGAFFHHFASKNEFGYCLVDEMIAEMIAAQWVTPLVSSDDVLETIATEFERGIDVLRVQQPILGCPLNNLAQEMNPLDAGFRERTTRVFAMWRDSYERNLRRGQENGSIAFGLDTSETASMLVAQIEGILSLARNS